MGIAIPPHGLSTVFVAAESDRLVAATMSRVEATGSVTSPVRPGVRGESLYDVYITYYMVCIRLYTRYIMVL